MAKEKTHVSDEKKKIVEEFHNLLETKKTILIASIKNLPAANFQQITKKLRGKAIVKVPKKSLIIRAIDDTKNENFKKIEENIHADVAVLFSNLDSFELAGYLLDNKVPAGAKPGQEAPEDIEVKAGMTDLVPGPAISELGAVGLVTKVSQGKLEITQDKIIAKKGEKIKGNVADVMSKLGIKPFSIGFIPLAAFDNENKKFYAEINIDKEGTLASLKEAYSRALPFAVEIGYSTPDTITFLLSKAYAHGKALEKLSPAEEKIEETPKENAETSDDKETINEKSEGENKPADDQVENSDKNSENIQTPETKSESGEEK